MVLRNCWYVQSAFVLCSDLHKLLVLVLLWVWELCNCNPIIMQYSELWYLYRRLCRSVKSNWKRSPTQAQLLLTCQWWSVCIYMPANTSAGYKSFLKALLKQCTRSVSYHWMISGQVELPAWACQGAYTTVLFWAWTFGASSLGWRKTSVLALLLHNSSYNLEKYI